MPLARFLFTILHLFVDLLIHGVDNIVSLLFVFAWIWNLSNSFRDVNQNFVLYIEASLYDTG